MTTVRSGGIRGGTMLVEEIMSRPVVTVDMDVTLGEVRRIFAQSRFHHLLVTDNYQLCGIISDRDLLAAVSPAAGTVAETVRDAATLNKKAHQIMSRKIITLYAEDDVMMAVRIFNEHSISGIPVINKEHFPVGMVSWRDIMRLVQADALMQTAQ